MDANGGRDRDAEFTDFVAGVQRRLIHFAELLTGDHGRAEDLVQDALVKAYVAWPRIRAGGAEAYVRSCIVNGRTDWWRRRSSREQPTALPTDLAGLTDAAGRVDERLMVLRALAVLTAKERAVIAMRFYLGLSEAQTAADLNIAVGTVKSTAARAITKLRTNSILHEGVTR
jgi:RNA polymerase sigma-70 factor (sigma-E family)